VQFVAGAADVSAYTASLVISEVNYHPRPPTTAENAAGIFDADQFEFIEIKNVSASPVSLADVRLTKGVDFDFAANSTLAPGGFALVVKNAAAMAARYGTGLPILGVFGGENLDNGGEQIKLSYGQGTTIRDFTYDDKSPWPTAADGVGRTLTLNSPSSLPNHALPSSWRASALNDGSPGADDPGITFQSWLTGYPLLSGDPEADDDNDGLTNRIEYAFSTHPLQSTASPYFAAGSQNYTVEGNTQKYLYLSFRRPTLVQDVTYSVRFSSDLENWTDGGVQVSSVPTANNTITETWRSTAPVGAEGRLFIQVQIE
jgi:hypothetical protein